MEIANSLFQQELLASYRFVAVCGNIKFAVSAGTYDDLLLARRAKVGEYFVLRKQQSTASCLLTQIWRQGSLYFDREAARAAIVRVFPHLFGRCLMSKLLFWFQGVGDSQIDKKNSYSSPHPPPRIALKALRKAKPSPQAAPHPPHHAPLTPSKPSQAKLQIPS